MIVKHCRACGSRIESREVARCPLFGHEDCLLCKSCADDVEHEIDDAGTSRLPIEHWR